jgi:phage terminase Nu1 subunit (DNA packaging protein)
MDAASSSIAVAAIATVGSIIITIIQQFRKENKKDHDTVMEAITGLHNDIKDVDKKLDGHIDWHLKTKK